MGGGVHGGWGTWGVGYMGGGVHGGRSIMTADW